MKTVRVLHRIFAFLIIPALGYLLGATIFNHFWDKIEPGPPREGAAVAVAQSCERHGPVSLRGFGFWWKCQAEVHSAAGIRTEAAKGFLKPEHIGKQVAITTTRRGDIVPVERPYQGLGGALLIPFFIVWLYVLIRVAGPVMPEARTKRRTPERYVRPDPADEPSSEVSVVGGRQRGWLFFVVLLGGFGVVKYNSSAFQDDTVATVVAVVSWAVIALVVVNVAWRLLFSPAVTISPEGLAWRKTKLSWAEIAEVRLTRRSVLVIQPRAGDVVRIGRFGDEEATRIHVAMGHFSQTQYTREGLQAT